MFGIGSQEFLVILLFVLLLFGGKRIPEVARTIGSGLRDFRKAMREVQQDVNIEAAMRASPSDGAGTAQPPRSRTLEAGDEAREGSKAADRAGSERPAALAIPPAPSVPAAPAASNAPSAGEAADTRAEDSTRVSRRIPAEEDETGSI